MVQATSSCNAALRVASIYQPCPRSALQRTTDLHSTAAVVDL